MSKTVLFLWKWQCSSPEVWCQPAAPLPPRHVDRPVSDCAKEYRQKDKMSHCLSNRCGLLGCESSGTATNNYGKWLVSQCIQQLMEDITPQKPPLYNKRLQMKTGCFWPFTFFQLKCVTNWGRFKSVFLKEHLPLQNTFAFPHSTFEFPHNICCLPLQYLFIKVYGSSTPTSSASPPVFCCSRIFTQSRWSRQAGWRSSSSSCGLMSPETLQLWQPMGRCLPAGQQLTVLRISSTAEGCCWPLNCH